MHSVSLKPPSILWASRYAPTTPAELVACSGQCAVLLAWHAAWPKSGTGAVITGPPGTGKTALARVFCTQAGIKHVLSLEAMSIKPKKLETAIRDALGSRSVESFFMGKTSQRAKIGLVLIDDADLVAEMGSVVRQLAEAKVPLLCTASDARGVLAKACQVQVKLARPSPDMIAARLLHIARAEGFADVGHTALANIAASCGGDVRQAITEFEFASKAAGAVAFVKSQAKSALTIDRDLDPYEIVPLAMGSSYSTVGALDKICRLAGNSLCLPLVAENYLRSVSGGAARPAAVANMAEQISVSDVLAASSERVYAGAEGWAAIVCALGVRTEVRKHGAFPVPYPSPPAVFEKTANTANNSRIIRETAGRLGVLSGKILATELVGYMHAKCCVAEPLPSWCVAHMAREDWEVIEGLGAGYKARRAMPVQQRKRMLAGMATLRARNEAVQVGAGTKRPRPGTSMGLPPPPPAKKAAQ